MLIEVHTTCGNEDEARRIALRALEEHLCACVHMTPIESHYWWQGVIRQNNEFRLSFKTISERYERLVDLIVGEHSYDLPSIYSTAVLHGGEDYTRWIETNSSN